MKDDSVITYLEITLQSETNCKDIDRHVSFLIN